MKAYPVGDSGIIVLNLGSSKQLKLTTEELRQAHDTYEEMFGNSPLYNFIKEEVPYRLREIFGYSSEQITPELVDGLVTALYDNSDVMFNYDALDNWLSERLDDRGKENDD